MRGDARRLWRRMRHGDLGLRDVLWARRLIGDALVRFAKWVVAR